jgi:hypothetical protein
VKVLAAHVFAKKIHWEWLKKHGMPKKCQTSKPGQNFGHDQIFGRVDLGKNKTYRSNINGEQSQDIPYLR